jgi:hypothetical protein
MAKQTVEAFLDDLRFLGGERYALVESVRTLVKNTILDVSEEVKYGGILFSSGVSFCGVFAYKQHVSVEFGRGASIIDTFGHLERGGKWRRHIKLYSEKDIEGKNVAQYLPLALEIAQSSA